MLSCSKTLFCRLEVESEGVSCESIDCLGGVTIRDGGSATVVKCTFIDTLNVEEGASLVMEDSRVSTWHTSTSSVIQAIWIDLGQGGATPRWTVQTAGGAAPGSPWRPTATGGAAGSAASGRSSRDNG